MYQESLGYFIILEIHNMICTALALYKGKNFIPIYALLRRKHH